MNSRVHRGLRGRPLASLVLACFLVFPAVGAWLGIGFNPAFFADTAPVITKRAPHSRTTSTPQLKRGWPRKALLQMPSVAAVTATADRGGDDTLEEWTRASQSRPQSGSRLNYCAEFTKPDSLCLRRMGTPVNHRAPPDDPL